MNKLDIKKIAMNEGLHIVDETIKINESGVDFRVAHAEDINGDKWILRIPRKKESMRYAHQEKKALDLMKKQVRFQVPNWSVYSDELIAYKELDGIPTATTDMEKQAYVWTIDENNVPDEYYHSLGETLADLHSVATDEFRNAGIPIVDSSDMRTSMKERMNRVKEQFNVNRNLWDRWQVWLANDLLWPTQTGLKHGDLHPGHILIDRNNSVTGLIDWTEVGVDDVSIDFTAHYLIFGKEGLTKLIHAYDNAGGRTWSKMYEHIVELNAASPIVVAEYAQVSGIKEMYDMASQMLASDS